MRSKSADRIRRTARGFSLIEVMIVIGVLAFGFLSLSVMQIHAMRGGLRGRHATDAAAIADAQMEQLQRLRWTNLTVTTGWTAPITVNNTVQQDSANVVEHPYSMSWRIADIVANSTRSVDVTVSWVEGSGMNRSISLSSIRFNRDSL